MQMPRSPHLLIPLAIAASALLTIAVPAGAALVSDGDMEQPDSGLWNAYGTPVTVEKSDFARSGVRSLKVVTDNQETMGGNYEGTSYYLGEYKAGDVLRVSFWYWVSGSKSIVVGMGPTYFVGRWVLSGTDWTRADLSIRCPKDSRYNIWLSQEGSATEFFVDDFELEVVTRPQLGDAAPEKILPLKGGPLSLSLCRDTGALCGIENSATGETYAKVGDRQPLFSMDLLSTDGLAYETIPFEQMKLVSIASDGPQSARLAFQAEAVPISTQVRVNLSDDGAAQFAATVTNGSDRTVLGLQLPMIYGVCPAANPEELTLISPYTCGRIIKNAINSDGCLATHPGRAAMGWLDLSGEKGGIYLATHDPRCEGTQLVAVPAPGPSFDMALTRETVVKPGETWECPPLVLAVHEGDWHASADRYGEWCRSWMQAPDVPPWMHNSDGWVLMGVQNGIPFHRIPSIYREAEWMGIDYLHVQGEGIDNMWFDEEGKQQSHALSYLYPSPKFGTPEELKSAVDEIHARNGRVMFYYLYERWTPSHSLSDDFGTGKRADVPEKYQPPGIDFYYDNALVERPGQEPPAEHPFMAHRMMCLASPGWQEWMRRWAIDIYADEYGADGFYWDVMGRNGPFRCFNERHGHEGQNQWTQGSAKVLETVVREGRKINPDYSCSIEGCSDILGQWVGFHLMSGGSLQPNVFRYTFPEYLCVDGFSNHTFKLTHPQKARRVLLDGERFDIHGYDQRVKKIINLRKRIKPFIDWPAVFKDTVGLTVSDSRVEARSFWRTDGENRVMTVTMLNEENVEGATVQVDLAPIGQPNTAHIFGEDGRVEQIPVARDDVLDLPVPADSISAAVIVARVAPDLAAWGWVEQIMRPGDDGLKLGIFLPAGSPGEVAIDMEMPPGVSGNLKSVEAESPYLRRMELLDENHLAGLKHWERVDVDLNWGPAGTKPWTVIAPPVVNGDFEELDANGRLVDWGAQPCADDPAEGKYCIQLDRNNMPHGHARLSTPLKPNCRYRFKCMLKRSGTATGGVGAHIVEYVEGLEFVRSAVLNSQKPGDWETLETEFTTHADPRNTSIFLYNFDQEKPAWFDAVELEELR